uniref:Putative secreted protein n=1 Tax=Ixodes ricinus TaxID=34613 RepID=A0A6B0U4H9_IXORI
MGAILWAFSADFCVAFGINQMTICTRYSYPLLFFLEPTTVQLTPARLAALTTPIALVQISRNVNKAELRVQDQAGP